MADTRKSAWITLVFGGESYLPGALVTGYSLRTVGTQHDIVCMVTPDVPPKAREDLAKIFDHVEPVEYLEHAARAMPTEKQKERYGAISTKLFTKWRCLQLARYDRVIMIDSDLTFQQNCDELFALAPPAACFSTPWARPYAEGKGIQNPYLEFYRRTSGDSRAPELPHGTALPAELVAGALGFHTFTMITAVTLLEPSAETFAALAARLDEFPTYGAKQQLISSTPEEALIADVLSGVLGRRWTHIHQRFEAVPRKPAWLGYRTFEELEASGEVACLHYLGAHPWAMSETAWPDLAPWWAEARRMLAAHPTLAPRLGLSGAAGGDAVAHPVGDPLAADLAQLRLTRELQRMMHAGARDAKVRYEADNVLERWLIAMANSAPGAPAWATVYRAAPTSSGFYQKMRAELVEKHLAPTPEAATTLIEWIARTVAACLDATPPAVTDKPVCTDREVSVGGAFRAGATPRLRELTRDHPCEAVARVAIRYATVLSGGQQWGLPKGHFADLYTDFGVRNEGFASPLNSRLYGKDGARFCSLFADTDAPFGSLGDFFGAKFAEHGGNWQVNPPFVEGLLARAADKVETELNAAAVAKRDLTVFFLAPAWDDAGFYRTLAASRHRVHSARLRRGRYRLEAADGRVFVARIDLLYFALAARPPPPAEAKRVREFLDGLNHPFDLDAAPRNDAKPSDRNDAEPSDRNVAKPSDRKDARPFDRKDARPFERRDAKERTGGARALPPKAGAIIVSDEFMANTREIPVRIIVKNRVSGVWVDAQVLADALRAHGAAPAVVVHDEATAAQKGQPAKVQIYVEHVFDAYPSARSFLLVNQEFLTDWDVAALRKGVTALCKTKFCQEFLASRLKLRGLLYTSFTTPFAPDASTFLPRKDPFLVVHLAGASPFKGTDALLRAWKAAGGFADVAPAARLFVLRSPGPLDKLSDDRKTWAGFGAAKGEAFELRGHTRDSDTGALQPGTLPIDNVERFNNMYFCDRRLSDVELCLLASTGGVHACPSLAEGFGHIINLGRAAGSVVVTTDAPPMNEMTTFRDRDDKGEKRLLVAADAGPPLPELFAARRIATHIQREADLPTHAVRPDALRAALAAALTLPPAERAAMGSALRKGYQTDAATFREAIKKLVV